MMPVVLFFMLQNEGISASAHRLFECTMIFDSAYSRAMEIYSGYAHVTYTATTHWQQVIQEGLADANGSARQR